MDGQIPDKLTPCALTIAGLLYMAECILYLKLTYVAL